MSIRQHLDPLAEAELAGLREAGVEPTWEHVARLNDLARKVRTPSVPSPTSKGIPSKVGDVWLWPFTLAGKAWYAWALKVFDGDEGLIGLALIYCLANGRRIGAFDDLWTADSARREISRWCRRRHVRGQELMDGVTACLAQELPAAEVGDDEDLGDPDYQALVGALTAHIGEAPDTWEHLVSARFAESLPRILAKQHEAEGSAPDPNDPAIIAEREIGIAVRDIRAEAVNGA